MIELNNIHKTYRMGEVTVPALRGVSLTIGSGEFLAIMGPSGSGKSTLLHILGLLDIPDSGSYCLNGTEVSRLSEDDLAALRRDAIGFVFQQFNLLPRMSALENAALPLLYSAHRIDLHRSRALLDRVGLGQRVDHRPNELSGGQQQRVAIARALINNPRIILADEPTGNLDSESAKDIMTALTKLNEMGITVVIVTHEEDIARHTSRFIRMRDGTILSDERNGPSPSQVLAPPSPPGPVPSKSFAISDLWQHLRQGLRTLGANKIRTALSVLGILIGVAAVVAMMALGRGAQKSIEAQLSSLGSNLLVVRQGAARAGGVSLDVGTVTRLTLEDASALKEHIPIIKAVSPNVQGRGQVTFMNNNWSTQILGAGPSYAQIHTSEPAIGRFFIQQENLSRKRVAVLGMTVVRELFGDKSPLGEMIKINKVGFQVIGILPEKGATGWRDQDDVIVIPVMTAMHRLMGKDYVDFIDIEAENPEDVDPTQKAVLDLLFSRHKVPLSQQQDAFHIHNMADIKEALTQTSQTMGYLLASIAAISLLVGGIGIMNIMLVSVTERTHEIGLRKAVGARRGDILAQFLTESVVISVVGGMAGIALGWLITQVISGVAGWATSVSIPAVLLAFFFSASIGVIFGMYPARKASLLNPIDALRYE